MDCSETLEYIHRIKWRGSKPGLARTRELLEFAGNPEKKLRFVHVAGTNGKGSTAALIASALDAAGYTVGLYTSPYINCFNERMQVNGRMITDGELTKITKRLRPFADKMADAPTEFELITAVAMLFFLEKNCDVVVLETGLGGELDSTNVIPVPDAAVITAIGLDHVKELGGTLKSVASAKAGIIKEGGSVVIYGGEPEADEVFRSVCRSKRARLIETDFSGLSVSGFGLDGCGFSYNGLELRIPLCGTYQPKNAAVAVTALMLLREKGYAISDGDIRSGFESVRWPGRFEVLLKEPPFILDGAHNVHGIRAAADSIRALFPGKKVILLMGVMADKDVENMAAVIAPLAGRVFTVTPDNPRAMSAEKLAEVFRSVGAAAQPCPGIGAGVDAAMEAAGKELPVCALGTLYFSHDVRAALAASGTRNGNLN